VNCPRCKVKWPDDVQLCGICGRELQAPSEADYVSENHADSGSSESRAIKVNSVPEEYEYMSRMKCACGGKFTPNMQMVCEREKRVYDELDIKCERCGNEHALIFDITSFFGKGPFSSLGIIEQEGEELWRQHEIIRKRRRNRRIVWTILAFTFLAVAFLWFLRQ